jgi:hypothetical protein
VPPNHPRAGNPGKSVRRSKIEVPNMESIASRDPPAHVANIRGEFQKLIQHLREDVDKIDDAKGQALFETAAEVLTGLSTAFEHYEQKSERAWQ